MILDASLIKSPSLVAAAALPGIRQPGVRTYEQGREKGNVK